MRILTCLKSNGWGHLGWGHLIAWPLLLLMISGCSQHPTAENRTSETGESEKRSESASPGNEVETDADSGEIVFGKRIESKMVARVTSVLDGDTIKVTTNDGQELVVRMESIDAPEGNAPFAGLVLEKVKALLEGKDVELLITGSGPEDPAQDSCLCSQ